MPKEERDERRKAKEQDKKYVEFRKEQILREIKPTTKAFDLKKFDESFPRERRCLRHAEMEFGELMHKYLTLRPDGRFAIWHGKPKKKSGKLLQALGEKMDERKKLGGPSKAAKEPSKRAQRNFQRALNQNLRLQDEVEEDDIDQKRLKEAYEYMAKEDVEAKNKYLLNAIVDGKPFWLIGDPLVPEEEEEDDYVDAKMIMDFINKKICTKSNQFERKVFSIYGPTAQLWNEMKQFTDKKLVIGNTLESIVASTEMKNERKRIERSVKRELKFCEKTRAIDYVMDSVPVEKTVIYDGKLEDIVRGKSNN
ncbi:unnamed protein product [Caenorhabditis bovis]|uniref:Uncharacterized protein n=1 Tax=Caenorhabditis bovis TaxID=2654633 RepID=A0A8S1EZJ7_9PELO|nr:unnamed protein product [Caenorhabditis bovis]